MLTDTCKPVFHVFKSDMKEKLEQMRTEMQSSYEDKLAKETQLLREEQTLEMEQMKERLLQQYNDEKEALVKQHEEALNTEKERARAENIEAQGASPCLYYNICAIMQQMLVVTLMIIVYRKA